MGPIELIIALIGALDFRVRRLFHQLRASFRAAGDWRTEWLLTPPEFRGPLARRIVSNGVLSALPRADLISALTAPEITNPPPSTYSLCWYIGPRRSGSALMFPYQEYLVVELDASGNAATIDIVNLA